MRSIANPLNLSDSAAISIENIRTLLAASSRPLSISALLFATLICISTVRADWLDDAWKGEHISRFGPPAITINTAGVVILLPEATMVEAQAAGLSPQQAAVAFLSRYGPEMCSSIIDLNEAKPALTITLVLLYRHEPSDAPVETQQKGAAALPESETGRQRRSGGRGIAFEAAPQEEVWTIDYVPTHRARCFAAPRR
jgi:hypothetical protein